MFKEAKANIAAAIIIAVLIVGGLLGFIFLYDFPEYYKVEIKNESTSGFSIVAEDGYSVDKIKEGSDFKFRVELDSEYSNSNITVTVNGEVVQKYESFDYYYIEDVQGNLQILITGLQRTE